MTQCQAKNKGNGKRCKNPAQANSDFCYTHRQVSFVEPKPKGYRSPSASPPEAALARAPPVPVRTRARTPSPSSSSPVPVSRSSSPARQRSPSPPLIRRNLLSLEQYPRGKLLAGPRSPLNSPPVPSPPYRRFTPYPSHPVLSPTEGRHYSLPVSRRPSPVPTRRQSPASPVATRRAAPTRRQSPASPVATRRAAPTRRPSPVATRRASPTRRPSPVATRRAAPGVTRRRQSSSVSPEFNRLLAGIAPTGSPMSLEEETLIEGIQGLVTKCTGPYINDGYSMSPLVQRECAALLINTFFNNRKDMNIVFENLYKVNSAEILNNKVTTAADIGIENFSEEGRKIFYVFKNHVKLHKRVDIKSALYMSWNHSELFETVIDTNGDEFTVMSKDELLEYVKILILYGVEIKIQDMRYMLCAFQRNIMTYHLG